MPLSLRPDSGRCASSIGVGTVTMKKSHSRIAATYDRGQASAPSAMSIIGVASWLGSLGGWGVCRSIGAPLCRFPDGDIVNVTGAARALDFRRAVSAIHRFGRSQGYFPRYHLESLSAFALKLHQVIMRPERLIFHPPTPPQSNSPTTRGFISTSRTSPLPPLSSFWMSDQPLLNSCGPLPARPRLPGADGPASSA
jgi:hypothetical protein